MSLQGLQRIASELLFSNVGLIAIFVLSCWSLFSYALKKPKNFPPGPTGIPILGVALSIGKRPEVTFKKWAKAYGDIIGFKVGRSFTVVLNSYDQIQQALVKHGAYFSNRPDNVIFAEELQKCGITASDYTNDFAIQRKFAHRILAKLGFGKKSMEPPILEEAQHLVEMLGKGRVKFNDEAKDKIKFVIGNVLAEVTFGEKFDDFKHPYFVAIVKALDAFFYTGAAAFKANLISPLLLHLPGIRESAQSITVSMKEYHEVIRKILKQHKDTFDPNNPRDFIDECFIEQMKNGTDKLYTDKMLEYMVVDVFGAGMETTSMMLAFALIALANRPHIRKKIHAEIDTVLGSSGKALFTEREKLPYCHAAIKECLRFRTVVPLLVPHAVHEDVNYNGYIIPKGSTVLPNIYAVHSNPEYWDKPEVFNPDRFINDKGMVETNKYFMPFGIGPRLCLGRALAEMEFFIIFVTILQHYDVVPDHQSGNDKPWIFDDVDYTGITANPARDAPVVLVSRHL